MSAEDEARVEETTFPDQVPKLPEDLPWAEGLDASALPLPFPDASEADVAELVRVIEEQYASGATVHGAPLEGSGVPEEDSAHILDRVLNRASEPESRSSVIPASNETDGHGSDSLDCRASSNTDVAEFIATPSPAKTPASTPGKRGSRSRKSLPVHAPVTPHPPLTDLHHPSANIDNDEYLIERSVAEAEESKQTLRDELKNEQREQEADAAKQGAAMTSLQKERSRSRRESNVTRRRAEIYLRELESIVREVPALQREVRELRADLEALCPEGTRRTLDLSSPSTSKVAAGIGRLGLNPGERDGARDLVGTHEGDVGHETGVENAVGDTPTKAEEEETAKSGLASSLLSYVTGT